MADDAFLAERHDLAGCAGTHEPIALARLKSDLADGLGAAFAAIDPWRSYPYPAAGLAAYFAADEPAAPRFGIYANNHLVGVAGLRLAWLRGPYVQFLGILPGYQGRGLGKAVLDWIEATARAQGERNLWVLASDFNSGARRFYERQGFSRVAELEGLVSDERAEVLLRKRL